MAGTSYRGPLSPLSAEQTALRDELRRHVEELAREIGERNVFKPAQLAAATAYIETTVANAGHTVARQTFKAGGETCHNLEIVIPGTTRRDEMILVRRARCVSSRS